MTEECKFNSEALETHNELRKLHNSPLMSLNKTLSSESQEWANHMAENTKFSHSHTDGKYGENIACSSKRLSGEEVTLLWYKEVYDYKFGEEKQENGKIGHFSQVVWKGSTEIGMGLAKGKNGMWYYVGRYLKPANLIGKYKENISSYSKDWENHHLIKKLTPKRLSSQSSTDNEKFANMKYVGLSKKVSIKKGVEITELNEKYISPDGVEHIKTTVTEKKL